MWTAFLIAIDRRFTPECTSDVFKQYHNVRHYLDTMHPYRDPLDKYRKFTHSRMKRTEDTPESPMTLEDFLRPGELTAERKTGYNPGHIRSVLQLDTFGPEHSAVVEGKRSAGKLPGSSHLDRNKDLRVDVCAASNKRSPVLNKTSKTLLDSFKLEVKQLEGKEGERPVSAGAATLPSLGSSSMGAMSIPRNATGTGKFTPSGTGGKLLFRPGTVPNPMTSPTKDDHLMTDSSARSAEWYRQYTANIKVLSVSLV